MASGTSAAAEEEPRERKKQRWSENSKVYTRRAKKNTTTGTPTLAGTSTATAAATATANNQTNENNIDNNKNENKEKSDHIPNGGTARENEDEKDEAPEKPTSSSPKVPVNEVNASQQQVTSSCIESGPVNSLILNRTEAPVPNGHGENLGNGSEKTVVTRVDDKVKITVSAARSKEVARELKRKLADELNQVRKMVKILEDKEIQIGRIDGGTTAPVVSNLQLPANGGREKGVGGGVKTVPDVDLNNKSRVFRQLSISVMDKSRGAVEVMEKEKRTPKANQYYRNSEFLLGKEKLPPAESHRKSKSSGSKKREIDYGFGVDKQLFKKCNNLLQKLMKHKHGWVFNQPVDVKQLGLHDYYDIIKHPMDLGTVNTRLTRNWYKTPREFAEDVRLTFHNAMTYNPEGQDVHVMAKELLRIFEERWISIETEFDRKLRYKVICDLGVSTPTSTKSSSRAHVPAPFPISPPPLLHHPPSFQEARNFRRSQSMPVPQETRSIPAYVTGRTHALKKPKAKDPNKRDMTFGEKQKLSTNLQSLPAEKLDAIVQIIKKNNTALSQHDDEIEVEIDSVDTETLWELDRFVINYKKNLSKQKRKDELAQARALAAQTLGQTNPTSVNVEASKETREGEVNVPGSPHAQQERRSDNDGGSSSSSSSSSDSGSSSSDSDSDSSSSSGSDGGQ